MDKKTHILLVDDEPIIQRALALYLEQSQINVGCAADGKTMDVYLSQHPDVDLIVMDLSMPGEDGLSITRRLRASGQHVPIIMVSSFGEDVDRIVGLEVGVDDYMAKPAHPREVLARIQAILRRQHRSADNKANTVPQQYDFGDFMLDCQTRKLYRAQQDIPITTAEFNLLKVFAEHPDQALDRNTLMERLKGYEHTPFDRSIDVLVRRLRQKIETDPKQPQYICTVWGKGYAFHPAQQVFT
jgi:two-component system phosphate regulon response regulator OmpR